MSLRVLDKDQGNPDSQRSLGWCQSQFLSFSLGCCNDKMRSKPCTIPGVSWRKAHWYNKVYKQKAEGDEAEEGLIPLSSKETRPFMGLTRF